MVPFPMSSTSEVIDFFAAAPLSLSVLCAGCITSKSDCD